MSLFSQVKEVPPIEVFELNAAYNASTAADKVNLGIGAFRTAEGKPWVLPVVRQVEKEIANDESLNHEYLPIPGLADFSRAAAKLVLGEQFVEERTSSTQCLSGTGSLRIGFDFIKNILGVSTAYVSSPTWGNHNLMLKKVGYTDIRAYRYWDANTKGVDFAGLTEDLKNAPEGALIIFHGVAHNPTGCDCTEEQWKQLSAICKEKKLIPFFDTAYQGFASGDVDRDAMSVRLFASEGHEIFIAQSFAKNFGLYNERIGNLNIVMKDAAMKKAVQTNVNIVVRSTWSNPPAHGARIVSAILNNPDKFLQWKSNVKTMADRMIAMRNLLKAKLAEVNPNANWDHLTTQIGMFCFTGLSKEQAKFLQDNHQIFLLSNGRINVCGINEGNVDKIAKAFTEAQQKVQ